MCIRDRIFNDSIRWVDFIKSSYAKWIGQRKHRAHYYFFRISRAYWEDHRPAQAREHEFRLKMNAIKGLSLESVYLKLAKIDHGQLRRARL